MQHIENYYCGANEKLHTQRRIRKYVLNVKDKTSV